jgi:hypothetical protein
MRKFKVITDFSDVKDADLDVKASAAVKAITGNTNFTFTGTQFTGFTGDTTTYHNKMAALPTGGRIAVTEKNVARVNLEKSFGAVAVIVNQQANGDLNKLQSSGIDLIQQPAHRQQPLPINFLVENGNNGDINVSVGKSPVGDYGTVFAYTPATNAASDINAWTLKPVNGHSAVVKGLPAGVAYLFSAAYKGSDDDDLVWAPAITKYVSN